MGVARRAAGRVEGRQRGGGVEHHPDVGGWRYPRPVQFVALLFAVAVVVKYWWLIVGIVCVIVAVYRVCGAVVRHERVEAGRRRLTELAARADQQPDWVMENDEHRICDEYPFAPI
jgi:hypothetical protein